jgi:hypothetical protein
LATQMSPLLLRQVIAGAKHLEGLVDSFGEDRLLKGHDVGLKRSESRCGTCPADCPGRRASPRC